MPKKDPAHDLSMTQLRRAWHENHGNWLLLVALLISGLAWIVGYFDLIPEMKAVVRTNRDAFVINGKTLEVEIRGCRSSTGHIIAMLYDATSFSESSTPLRMQALEIQDRGAIWRIRNLRYGKYAIYAFHDENADDIVQPNVEPQGFSLNEDSQSEELGTFTFADAGFDFSPTQTKATVQLHSTFSR